METVGIRALKQNASAVVAEVASGKSVIITDRGRPVAQIVPLTTSRLQELVNSGRVRQHRRTIADVPPPTSTAPLSKVLAEMRDEERY